MTQRWVIAVSTVALCLETTGCRNLDPAAGLKEAGRLVERYTGQRPDWEAAWDPDSRIWDGESVLRLEDALVLALRNHRELRADLETIGQANADLLQATLFSNPVVSFMIMFPDGGGRSMLRGSGIPIQPLQDLWLVPVRTEVARRELQRTVLRVADRAVEIAAEVKRIYSRLQYAQRALELIRDNIEVVHQSTEIIRIRQSAGQATQAEVTLSEIRALRLESDWMVAEAESRNLKRDLLLLMGRPSAADAWTVEPVEESRIDVTPPPPEEELLRRAEENRLDLGAAEWTVRAAEERIRLRRREGWPELTLGLSFERSPAPQSNNPSLAGRAGNAAAEGFSGALTGNMGGGTGRAPFAPKMRDVKYMLGPMLDLEIPIFDWGQAQTARAVAELAQRIAEYEALAHQIIRNVRQSRVTNAQAYKQLAFYRDSVLPAVERNLQVARQSFMAGRENITVYLGVQEDLISTRLRALEFLRDYLVTRADLERQVGGGLAPRAPSTRPADDPSPASTQPTIHNE